MPVVEVAPISFQAVLVCPVHLWFRSHPDTCSVFIQNFGFSAFRFYRVSPSLSGGLCFFGSWFFFSAIKTRNYFIGDLVFTRCGHGGWWLMPQFRLILVCPMHTCFESLPETWTEFLYNFMFFSCCLLCRVLSCCLVGLVSINSFPWFFWSLRRWCFVLFFKREFSCPAPWLWLLSMKSCKRETHPPSSLPPSLDFPSKGVNFCSLARSSGDCFYMLSRVYNSYIGEDYYVRSLIFHARSRPCNDFFSQVPT